MSEDLPFFRYVLADHIATITIDRADKLNAFTRLMAEDLTALIDRADGDDDIRAIIITGAGRVFCAGADLSGANTSFTEEAAGPSPDFRDFGGLITLRLFDCLKPAIIAFNGPAVGMGATLALAADYRIASTTARFAFPFVRRGIAPESCSSWFLSRLVGLPQALDWMLTGRTFDADEALARGLVRSLHPPDELPGAARRIAEEIAAQGAPISVAITRRLLWRMAGSPHPLDAHRFESSALASRFGTPDVREGVASFLEKRAPRFTGRVSTDLPDDSFWRNHEDS
ncbi:MAG TPA: enoyl-CoA hydratase-related protein [Sphingomonas sp.]|nr:enoyl-CoA hydratase-related protein [Sphingomonas sp.]